MHGVVSISAPHTKDSKSFKKSEDVRENQHGKLGLNESGPNNLKPSHVKFIVRTNPNVIVCMLLDNFIIVVEIIEH